MIKAEMKRLLNKKKDWLYYGILYTLFLILIFFLKQKQNIDAQQYLTTGEEILSAFFVLFVGTRLFTTLYLDDISANKYTMILSNRRKTYQYLIEKNLLAIASLFFILLLSFLFFSTIFAVLYSQSWTAYRESLPNLFKIAFNRALLSLVFMNLAAISAYYFQNAASGKASYLILSLNFIPTVLKIAALFSEKLHRVQNYLFSEAANMWMLGETKITFVLLLGFAYLLLSNLVTYFILETKDLA